MSDRPRLTDLPDVLQIKDVASFLGTARSTVYEAIRSRRLRSVQITPHRSVVTKSALLDFLGETNGRESNS